MDKLQKCNDEGRKQIIHIKFKHTQNNIFYIYACPEKPKMCMKMIKFSIVVSGAGNRGRLDHMLTTLRITHCIHVLNY
jgi:hypothetical protein